MMNDDAMNEIVQEFLVETNENLDQLDQDLVALESNPRSRELLGSIFRTIHTVKGTTGFLGFGRLEKISHAAESLLSELRDGKLDLTGPRTDVLLEVVDVIRVLLSTIEQTGTDGEGDLSELISRIELLQQPDADAGAAPAAEAAPEVAAAPKAAAPKAATAKAAAPKAATAKAGRTQKASSAPAVVADEPPVSTALVDLGSDVAGSATASSNTASSGEGDDVALVHTSGSVSVSGLDDEADDRESDDEIAAEVAIAEADEANDDEPGDDVEDESDDIVVASPAAKAPAGVTQATAVAKASPIVVDVPDAPPADGHRLAAERSVRVDVDLLDSMMSQVGELVLARNQVSAHVDMLDNQPLHQTVQRLSMIVSELQEGVMKTRMQAVEQLWSKLPRVVRDLAAQFSKRVALEMEGGETELDRSLLEAVKDPLTHLVRNAIDHAIEMPADRVAAGKPETGTLMLRAFHEGGQVVLEVADDGAGIDPVKIGDIALERGVVSQMELDSMSEREIVDLIFRPGFSTAKTVTNVSGRGVGMDVVRTNVERIGGTVDLSSTPGIGTTFRIKIPLTLAIMPALLIGCRGERYAIPQTNLLEMVQLRTEEGHSDIERIGGALVYRLRGKLLPLVRLDETLGFAPLETEEQHDAVSIVVLQADGLLLGVAVDDVIGTEEIVVKPLGQHVKQVPLFAGATILGDGSVALILDVIGVAATAKVEEVAASLGLGADSLDDPRRGERSTFVLLRVGEDRRVAVPLKAVSRLEEAPIDSVEQAGTGHVMQYRGDLLPLVSLATFLDGTVGFGTSAGEEGPASVPVVVYSDGERNLGLVASEILDIVEGIFEISTVGAARGILGSTVVHGHVTDVLDVEAAFNLSMKEVGNVH